MKTRTPGTAGLAAPLALAACHHSSDGVADLPAPEPGDDIDTVRVAYFGVPLDRPDDWRQRNRRAERRK